MVSLAYVLVFTLTLWLSVYLWLRAGINKSFWLFSGMSFGIAIGQVNALMAITSDSPASVDFWTRTALVIGSILVVAYTTLGLVLVASGSSVAQRIIIICTYGIDVLLAELTSRILRRGGSLGSVAAPAGFSFDEQQSLYIVLVSISLALTIMFVALKNPARRRDQQPSELSFQVAGMPVLAVATIFPCLVWIPPQYQDLGVEFATICFVAVIGYTGWHFRARVKQPFSWKDALAFVPNAMLLTVFAGICVMLLAWWFGQNVRASVLTAFAICLIALAAMETTRLKLSSVYLSRFFPSKTWGYYEMSSTIQRAVLKPDMPQMMASLLVHICDQCGISRGIVALRANTEDSKMTVVASHGTARVRIGEAVTFPDANLPDALSTLEGMAIPGYEEFALLLPLVLHSNVAGIVALGPTVRGQFQESEIKLLTALSRQISLAIENAQLKQQLGFEFSSLASKGDAILQRQSLLRESMQSTLTNLSSSHVHSSKQIRVNCLGRFEVYLGETLIEDRQWGGKSSGHRHVKAVFAFLMANKERVVRRDELIEVIWGEEIDEKILQNRLDRTISALRRALEPGLRAGADSEFIVTDVDGYSFTSTIEWSIDAEDFSRLCQDGESLERSADATGALAKYLQAETLYRGDYLIDCAFLDRSIFIIAKREQLRRQYVDLLVRIARVHENNKSPDLAISFLRKAALEDEYNEEVHRALIRDYCNSNRLAEASLTCQTHKSILDQAALNCTSTCFPPTIVNGSKVAQSQHHISAKRS